MGDLPPPGDGGVGLGEFSVANLYAVVVYSLLNLDLLSSHRPSCHHRVTEEALLSNSSRSGPISKR